VQLVLHPTPQNADEHYAMINELHQHIDELVKKNAGLTLKLQVEKSVLLQEYNRRNHWRVAGAP